MVVKKFFCTTSIGYNVLVAWCLGYGIHEDMRMLIKAIPVLHDYVTRLSIIDAHVLHQQVSSALQ